MWIAVGFLQIYGFSMAIATLLRSVEFFYLSLFIYLFLCFAMGFVACVMVG